MSILTTKTAEKGTPQQWGQSNSGEQVAAAQEGGLEAPGLACVQTEVSESCVGRTPLSKLLSQEWAHVLNELCFEE